MGSVIKYLMLFLILFQSCKKEEIPLPISKEKMVNILFDLHVMESSLKMENEHRDSLYNLYMSQIEQIHQVTKEDIDSTMTLLNLKPNEFYKVYKEVGENLNAMKGGKVDKNKLDSKVIK